MLFRVQSNVRLFCSAAAKAAFIECSNLQVVLARRFLQNTLRFQNYNELAHLDWELTHTQLNSTCFFNKISFLHLNGVGSTLHLSRLNLCTKKSCRSTLEPRMLRNFKPLATHHALHWFQIGSSGSSAVWMTQTKKRWWDIAVNYINEYLPWR